MNSHQTLFRNRRFTRFWTAATVSTAGSQVTMLALPLTAIMLLHADAAQLGILAAAQLAPPLVMAPVAGALSGRLPTHLVHAGCDTFRGVLLLGVPLLAGLQVLTLGWLYVLSLLMGCCKALADVTHPGLLPALLPRQQLLSGHTAVHTSYAVTSVAGPGTAGVLIHAVTAPYAMVLGAVSCFLSGGLTASLKGRGVSERRSTQKWIYAVRDGFAYAAREKPLLMLGIAGGIANVFIQAYLTVFILYAVLWLHLSVLALGCVYAVGALGGWVGVAVSRWLSWRFSHVNVMSAGNITAGVGMCALALAAASNALAWRLLCATLAVFLYTLGVGVFNTHAMRARQRACRPDMLGRVTAAYRLLSSGALTLGALLGGYCACVLGAGFTIALAGTGLITWMTVVRLTPFRHLTTRWGPMGTEPHGVPT